VYDQTFPNGGCQIESVSPFLSFTSNVSSVLLRLAVFYSGLKTCIFQNDTHRRRLIPGLPKIRLNTFGRRVFSVTGPTVLMYGCETWATTKYPLSRLDAFDKWALRKILRIPYPSIHVYLYTRHVSNAEVRRTTGCSPLSHLVSDRRLRLFGHIARSSPREDHHRALAACIRQVPSDWKRPAGRPSHTWLRAIEADLGLLNFGLATAWRKTTTRDEWRHIVDTATLQRSTL